MIGRFILGLPKKVRQALSAMLLDPLPGNQLGELRPAVAFIEPPAEREVEIQELHLLGRGLSVHGFEVQGLSVKSVESLAYNRL